MQRYLSILQNKYLCIYKDSLERRYSEMIVPLFVVFPNYTTNSYLVQILIHFISIFFRIFCLNKCVDLQFVLNFILDTIQGLAV